MIAFFRSGSFAGTYLLFLCLLIVLMFASGIWQGLWLLWRISEAPVAAVGHVTRLDCPNHGHIDYSFEAAGQTRDVRNTFIHGADCRALKIGQPIAIYYERDVPANSYALTAGDMSGNPAQRELIMGFMFMGAFLLLGPLFVGWLFSVFNRWAGK